MKRPTPLWLALALWSSLACSTPARAQAAGAGSPVALTEMSQSFQGLAERVLPSVVAIRVWGFALDPDRSRGTRLTRVRGEGSGVVVDGEGTIVTNAHVVEGAERIAVRVAPGRPEREGSVLAPASPWREARLIGVDLETDLAVLRVAGSPPPALPLADSEALRPGQLVLAFGNPLGFESSVSLGVVSAPARQVDPDSPMIYVQTDAAINPGSSGGPLVDASGAVVGINTFIITEGGGSDGVGFAAPSSIVSSVVSELCRFGRVRRRTLGLSTQTITPELARGLALARPWGVIVADVAPGVRGRVDVRPGDVLLTLGGKEMENARQFEVNQYRLPLGGRVALTLQRGDRVLSRTLPVLELRDPPLSALQGVDPELASVLELGVVVAEGDGAEDRAVEALAVAGAPVGEGSPGLGGAGLGGRRRSRADPAASSARCPSSRLRPGCRSRALLSPSATRCCRSTLAPSPRAPSCAAACSRAPRPGSCRSRARGRSASWWWGPEAAGPAPAHG